MSGLNYVKLCAVLLYGSVYASAPIPRRVYEPEPYPLIPTSSWITDSKVRKGVESGWWKVGRVISPRKEFFRDVVGMSEEDFRQRYNWSVNNPVSFKTQEELNNWIAEYPRSAAIFSGVNNGVTGVYTVQGLLEKIKLSPSVSTRPYLTILLDDPVLPWESDVRYLQSFPGNKTAVFQIASTFFGPLEGGMATEGKLLREMFPYAAQGEEASVSAAGGTIWRKYMMGQPLYLLEYLKDKLPLFVDKQGRYSLEREYLRNYAHGEQDYEKVGVFIQDDVVVTSGYGHDEDKERGEGAQQRLPVNLVPGTLHIDRQSTQFVTQVYTSAIRVRDYWNDQGTWIDPHVEAAARMVLRASYLGTLAAAAFAQKPIVFLTLMGCGAFANDVTWVGQAIAAPQTVNLIRQYGLKTTVVYRPDKVRDVAGYRRSVQTDVGLFNYLLQAFVDVNGLNIWNYPVFINGLQRYIQLRYELNEKPRDLDLRERVHQLASALNRILMLPALLPGELEHTENFRDALQTIASLLQ